MNLVTFVVISGILSGWGYYRLGMGIGNFRLGLAKPFRSRGVLISLIFGCCGALALMALLTDIGFIPDDWSASRLTWPGGLLCGYHLYMGNEGPSNGFFYPPVGAWFYLPAAALGLLLHSPMAALIVGWSMSLFCIFAPIALLLVLLQRERKRSGLLYLVSFFIAVSLVFAAPQLRYVATMIHVDSPAILFLGLSLVLLLPIGGIGRKEPFPINLRMMLAGCCMALSALCKQSVWPLVPALIAASVIWHGFKAGMVFFLVSLLTGILILAVMLFLENWQEAYRMIWEWPSHQIVVTPVSAILKQLLISNVPILGMLALLFLGSSLSSESLSPSVKQSFLFLLGLTLWMIPFAVLTRMRVGADWNHLAIPSYLALLAILLLLPEMIFGLSGMPLRYAGGVSFLILGILAFSLAPYLSQNCGWYLWTHNSHEQALKFSQSASGSSERVYFPWQTFSTLIKEKKLYHLDDCLRYEESAGWKRPEDSIARFLPEQPFKIAIRSFGAPSYLTEKNRYKEVASIPELPGWHIYQPPKGY